MRGLSAPSNSPEDIFSQMKGIYYGYFFARSADYH